ncbi:hypothetical protein IJG72_04235 [bacterium]|nr:hypothetical protein [bacterium]
MNVNPINVSNPNPPKQNFTGLNGGKFFGMMKGAVSGAADAGAKKPGKISEGITKGLTWFLDKCSKLPGFSYFAEMAESSQMMFGAVASLLMAGILRPLAIFALPDGKDEKAKEQSKKDKGNAAGHAISSALVGFVFTVSIAELLKRGFKKSDIVKNTIERLKNEGKEKYADAYQSVCTFTPDNIIAIPRALLTAVAAAPIGTFLIKHVFGIDSPKNKDSKKELPQQIEQNNKQPENKIEILEKKIPVAQEQPISNRPILDTIRGGNA